MQESAENRSGAVQRRPVVDVLSRVRVRRFSAVEFLIVLAIWIVSASFLLQVPYGDLFEAVLATAVLASAVIAVGGRRRTLIVALVLATPIFVCKWINHLWPATMPRQVYTAGLILFMVFIAGHHLRFVLRAPRVNAEVLCAGISIYLMLGVLWAFAYMLVAEFYPGSFSFSGGSDPHRILLGFEAVYFSIGVLGGFAFGDIVPASNGARILAVGEATVGLFYVTILIARLVSLYSSEKPSDGRS